MLPDPMDAASPLDPDLLARIKDALRRDLKLAPDEPIADDMPLVGGETEIDSIDVLLIIGTLEQEFGVTIPDRDVSEQAFATVATLTAYVQGQQGGDAASGASPESAAGVAGWRDRLPHGDAFLYVSDVRELVPGERCVGVWRVTGEEPFLRGHFPGSPLVPGVLVTEALAQVAGLASARAGEAGGVLASVEIKFLAPVPPPVDIELTASVRSTAEHLRLCDVSASVDGKPVASGTIALALTK